MANYLNAHAKNVVMVASAFVTWLKDIIKNPVRFERWPEIQVHMEVALEQMEKAFHKMMIPVEKKQRGQIERISSTSRIVVITDADARYREKVVEVDLESFKYIAGCAINAECRMCTRTEAESQKCKLKYHLLRTAVNDIDQSKFGSGECEFSKL